MGTGKSRGNKTCISKNGIVANEIWVRVKLFVYRFNFFFSLHSSSAVYVSISCSVYNPADHLTDIFINKTGFSFPFFTIPFYSLSSSSSFFSYGLFNQGYFSFKPSPLLSSLYFSFVTLFLFFFSSLDSRLFCVCHSAEFVLCKGQQGTNLADIYLCNLSFCARRGGFVHDFKQTTTTMENVLLNLPLICTFASPRPNHILLVSGFFRLLSLFFFGTLYFLFCRFPFATPPPSSTHFLLTFSTCAKLVNIVILVKKELLSSFFYAPFFFTVADCSKGGSHKMKKNVQKCRAGKFAEFSWMLGIFTLFC